MIYARNKITGEHRAFIGGNAPAHTGSDWEFIEATPDGWIDWQGGECPLTDGVNHQVKTRDGCKSEIIDTPGCFRWSHWGDYSDIIAYRPVLDEPRQATLAGAKLWQDDEGTIPCREGDPVGRVGEPPAWDGEGLPPVGCECNVRGSPAGSMCPAVIDYIDDKHCIWHWKGGRGETIHARVSTMEFHPIRSEEDEAVHAMRAQDCEPFEGMLSRHDFCLAIYHAIRDGKVPGVKLAGGE